MMGVGGTSHKLLGVKRKPIGVYLGARIVSMHLTKVDCVYKWIERNI